MRPAHLSAPAFERSNPGGAEVRQAHICAPASPAVRDGQYRVSVALARGAVVIDAVVTAG